MLCGVCPKVQEATAHPLAIAETGRVGDLFDRQAALLEHEFGGFEPEIFDGLGGRLSGLSSEHAGELAWTETRSFGKLSQGQRLAKVLSCVGERHLHPIGFASSSSMAECCD